ncbi:MAG TPA: hypothetical protein VLD67_16910 [Vicinamibacterales bacterium]|nr:hypothetical protein [Vicinamibacterales bacterium]
MTIQKLVSAVFVAAVLMTAVAGSAQTSASSADIQRLQDEVNAAGRELSRLRATDVAAASRLQEELDVLAEEVIYLKVKLRKEGTVSRREYADVRDRLQDVRWRARGEATNPPAVGVSGGATGDRRGDPPQSAIPVGTEIDVRLQSTLSSDTAQVEDTFDATTIVDLYQGNRVLIPAGSLMRGFVTTVDRASRTDRKGSLTVLFNRITVEGRSYAMRGTVTEALESEGIRGEIGRIGAGAAVGGIIGGIIGGTRGALLGVLIGGGGTIAATEGKDVTLPPGTILRVRFDQPPAIR